MRYPLGSHEKPRRHKKTGFHRTVKEGRAMPISQEVNIIGQSFVNGLKRILGQKLYGAYIYGAAAFPDEVPTGDIDFHVILQEKLTNSERRELEILHESLSIQYPPLGEEMDGYYILLSDARRSIPPKSQMWQCDTDESWALHCQHIRAGRHIILYGPDPATIYPRASWPEIEKALFGELNFVARHLHKYPDFCILNLCRLIYSFETREVVVSKAQTSEWAFDALPEWKRHIALARKSYADQVTDEEKHFMLAEIVSFFKFAHERIERIQETQGKNKALRAK
jgi:hypothetical protein